MIISLIIAAGAGLVIILLAFGIYRSLRVNAGDDEFRAVLEDVRRSEIDEDLNKSVDVEEKGWAQYWYKLFIKTGRISPNPATPSRLALIFALFALGVGTLVWPGDIVGGLIGAFGALAAFRSFLILEANRRSRALERQLPNMLSGMRANLQANHTPPQAIIAIAEDVPSPLGDELKLLRNDLAVNIPLETALRTFSDRVPSREIKFLAASIEIAVASGADLDPQLQTIQGIVDQRTRMRQKLASAVAQAQPAMVVSGFIIPAGFLFSFYSSPSNSTFWTSFFGLVAGGIVALLYVAGLFISKKLVDGVANT